MVLFRVNMMVLLGPIINPGSVGNVKVIFCITSVGKRRRILTQSNLCLDIMIVSFIIHFWGNL